ASVFADLENVRAGFDDFDRPLWRVSGAAEGEAVHAARNPAAGPRLQAVVRSLRMLAQFAPRAEHDGVASAAGRPESEGVGRAIDLDAAGLVLFERVRPTAAWGYCALIHCTHDSLAMAFPRGPDTGPREENASTGIQGFGSDLVRAEDALGRVTNARGLGLRLLA